MNKLIHEAKEILKEIFIFDKSLLLKLYDNIT